MLHAKFQGTMPLLEPNFVPDALLPACLNTFFLQRSPSFFVVMMLYIKLLKNAFKNAIKGPAAAIDGSNSFNVIKTTIVKIEGQSHVK